ncbi:MAG: helical backbone metal receptor [Ilumatobacteraceae bacterium]|jgi:iron complex transport system substrate-binding protein|nr:helical backbone metal receptor [Ilumatobacteraceae bacterium]
MTPTSTRRRRIFAFLAVPLMTLAACGGSDSSSETTNVPDTNVTEVTYPVTVTAANGDVTLAAKPEKIVSLSPTATEMLYAIGAGDQVAAIDDMSNYPVESASKASKLSGFEPNVEAIAAYEPDLVVISNDIASIAQQLTSLNIPVWLGSAAATLDDTYTQVEQLGTLTGNTAGAQMLVAQMKSDIETALSGVEKLADVPVFWELDDTYFSITSNTFVGALLTQFGFKSIADGVEAGNDYPQLNAESIIAANPKVVFLADTKCCTQDAAKVAARPGWSAIDAVINSRVVELDDDVASRWGPRIVNLVKALADAAAKVSS